MSLGQIHNINIVADTSFVRRIIVVAEDSQLLSDPHRRLGHKRNQVHRYTIRQLTNECCRMGTNRIEVSQDDAFYGCPRVNIVLNDLLVDLLGVAVRAHGLLDRSILRHRQILLRWLTIDRTTR